MADRTVRLIVEVPNVPDDWTDDEIRAHVDDSLNHPIDAYFDAGITVVIDNNQQ